MIRPTDVVMFGIVLIVDLALYGSTLLKPTPKPVIVVQVPTIEARDTVLYMSCPNAPLRKIHYSQPITWGREKDVDGRRIVFATDSGKLIAAFPGNTQCIIERDMSEPATHNFSRWAP